MASVRLKSYDGEVHDLPDVCMKCGAPSSVRKNKTFSWCPGFMTKRCDVEAPLCERHKNHWLKRKLLVLLSLLGIYALLGAACVIVFATDSDRGRNDALYVMLCAGCVVLLIGWIILACIVQSTTIRPTEITDTSIKLTSVSEEFAAACKEELSRVRGQLDRIACLLFPNMKGMSLEITEELIARQTPEAQAIIRALLAKIQELQDCLNQSPRNSSFPPSPEHPHAQPISVLTPHQPIAPVHGIRR